MKRVFITFVLLLATASIISAQFFFDDFESYNVGEQLVFQNPDDWTTWSNFPGSNEDPFIQNLGSNVVIISATNDLVYDIQDYFFGYWEIQFDLYVPEGGDAYFNTLQQFSGSSSQWGMQVYFGHTNYGEGNIDGGGALAQVFTFSYDTWMTVKVTVDLDNDWAEFYLDDVLIHEWIWSTGTFGTGTLNQLGGNNFFAWPDGVFANPNYYIDNYSVNFEGVLYYPPQNVDANLIPSEDGVHISWLPPQEGEPIGYKIWREEDSLDYVNSTVLEYDDLYLDPGTYEYCVSTVYDEGESPQACADPVAVPSGPPSFIYNLSGPDYIELGDTICLTWEVPWGSQWIRWDAGVNTGNGIGYLSGGTFRCASRWYPEQLTSYAGLQIMEIEFYNNGDPDATYTIKIWTGPDANNEVLSQEVPSFNIDDWNTVVLYTPHTINAAEDLWFGYEITHEGSTFPAGCDDGPAIPFNGDMLYWVDEWVSMSETLGFNYNWNLAASVGYADGKDLISMTKTDQADHSRTKLNASYTNSMNNAFLSDGIEEFSHFNLYVKPPGVSFFTVVDTSIETEICYIPTVSGIHEFYVTAVFVPEGELGPSDIHVCDVLTGIEDMRNRITRVFPNPASDFISIDSEFNIISLKIYNLTGRTIAEEKVNNNNYIVDVSQLNPGIYFLQIEFEEKQILRKIVVE